MILSYLRPSVCPYVTLCIVAKWYILQQKCLNKWIGSAPYRIPFYNFQPLALTLSSQTPHLLKSRRWCHLANTLKHTASKRTAKISTPGIAIVSMLYGYYRLFEKTPYDRLFLGDSWACLLRYVIAVCVRVCVRVQVLQWWSKSAIRKYSIRPALIMRSSSLRRRSTADWN